MPQLDGLSLSRRTDRLAQAPASRYEPADGYTACRTSERGDYVFGNYLILDEPPAADDLPAWIERAVEMFCTEPGTRPAVVQWEQFDRYSWPELPGSTLIEHLVLAGTEFVRVPASDRAVHLAEVVTDGQWADLVRFAACETATDEAWTRWRYAQYRALGSACRWLVALDGDRIVAAAGLVSDARLDRFQEVVTAADRRRRGLATAVCGELLRRTERPERQAVAVADPTTGADRVYRALGLEPVGYQYTVMAPAVPARSGCDA
ncbi:MAG: GNAT family N-acetyltransferase [Jatrophihabitantaceae bacterium]